MTDDSSSASILLKINKYQAYMNYLASKIFGKWKYLKSTFTINKTLFTTICWQGRNFAAQGVKSIKSTQLQWRTWDELNPSIAVVYVVLIAFTKNIIYGFFNYYFLTCFFLSKVGYLVLHQDNEVCKESHRIPPINATNTVSVGYKFLLNTLHTVI